MKDNVINEKNVKIPLHVTACETINQWLKEGKYKVGDKLPGGNIPAERLAVSRGTLRQAMLLLQEGDLVINRQGRGSVVLSDQDTSKSGLEKVGSPIVDFCSRSVDKAVTAIGFQPTAQKRQQVLKLQPSSVAAVIGITYYCGDTSADPAIVYVSHKVLDSSDMDLKNPDIVYQYYARLLSEGGPYSDAKIRLGQARRRLANTLNIQEGNLILTLKRVLHSEYNTSILSQELFFDSEQHELNIRRKNNRNVIKKSE